MKISILFERFSSKVESESPEFGNWMRMNVLHGRVSRRRAVVVVVVRLVNADTLQTLFAREDESFHSEPECPRPQLLAARINNKL